MTLKVLRRFVLFALLPAVLLCILAIPFRATWSPRGLERYGPPMPVVLLPATASARELAAAEKFCRHFFPDSPAIRPQRSDRNPICCVWLEIDPALPRGIGDGYVISHDLSGNLSTRISASSPEALERGVDAMIASSRKIDGRVMVPVGVQTSYPVLER